MKFYFPILPVKINQCRQAKRLSVNIPNKPHFLYTLSYLQKNGYIRYFYNNKDDSFDVFPKYTQDGTPVLSSFRVVSTPSNRTFVDLYKLRSMLLNHRLSMIHYIVSTRKGFMTAREAYHQRIGGELIYEL